ncbi:MAG: discoidin domain-containing protein, partial [Pirellulales bacterium]
MALHKNVKASSTHKAHPVEKLVDGDVGTRWRGVAAPISWIEIDLGAQYDIGGIHVYSGAGETVPIENFVVECQVDGQWKEIPGGAVMENDATALAVAFTEKVNARVLRLVVARTNFNVARISEVTVWPYAKAGIPPLGTGVIRWSRPLGDEDIPVIYLNQSGFNLNRPKRFTAPTLEDGTPFVVRQKISEKPLFAGMIKKHIGEFTNFNPTDGKEYVVEAGGHTSFPFRIAPWWLERVTYQNAVDFMADTRHYHGTFTGTAGNSFGWRDDCHFAFEINSLVAQYLSNPIAYERMPRQIEYKQPPQSHFWGYLEPYPADAPDIVKLIHWGADVIVSNNLRHEMFKEQCAYFLYAWPWLKKWLPEQNYRVVAEHAFAAWGDSSNYRRYAYDESPENDLFAVKTKLGSTKGGLPPGHSVQPNLLMYEVAKREGRDDAEKYFDAAFAQTKWMIANLDWNDPQTTKGQRMSEHVTMTGLAHFIAQYPERAPKGLKQKIVDWANVMVRRSDNLWDFRRLTDDGDWVPPGWNEPGNVAGFPACLLAAAQVVEDERLNERLVQLAYSHMDNVFGRNPTGRHFSHDGHRQIEGVDLGWYSCWRTGVGMLQKSRFILDGSPKNEHYPYHPTIGNAGGTEGWVNFNTAFNVSLAYLAHHDTDVRLIQKHDAIGVRLRAPLNFDYRKPEPVTLRVVSSSGDIEDVTLKEKQLYAEEFTGSVPT